MCSRLSGSWLLSKIVEIVSIAVLSSEYVVQYVKETCETVHSMPMETSDKVTPFKQQKQVACAQGGNKNMTRCASVQSRIGQICVENFYVLSRRCSRRHKGPAVPERDLQKMDERKIDFGLVFQTHEDARDEIFRTLSIGKSQRRSEHSV